jgi:2,3-bisphosphoglycerate-dependent phosphoglycerate mutase
LPKAAQPFVDWQLSPVGTRQALQLANLLAPLDIAHAFSSPFLRSLDTARPFALKHGLPITVVDDLRERHLTSSGGLAPDHLWHRAWEDFSFCLDGGENSAAAQVRICRAIRAIAEKAQDVTVIFTHGDVIALFLNTLSSHCGRNVAERLTNPDVLKLDWSEGTFAWDSHFRLAGLESIATDHRQTPREFSATDA